MPDAFHLIHDARPAQAVCGALEQTHVEVPLEDLRLAEKRLLPLLMQMVPADGTVGFP